MGRIFVIWILVPSEHSLPLSFLRRMTGSIKSQITSHSTKIKHNNKTIHWSLFTSLKDLEEKFLTKLNIYMQKYFKLDKSNQKLYIVITPSLANTNMYKFSLKLDTMNAQIWSVSHGRNPCGLDYLPQYYCGLWNVWGGLILLLDENILNNYYAMRVLNAVPLSL